MNFRHLSVLALLLSTAAAAGAQTKSSFVVGAGVGAGPEYLGGDRFRAIPVIFVDYQNADGWFASVTRGLGYTTTLDRLTFSAALGYDGGRHDSKRGFGSGSDDLRGMGKIEGAALAKLQAGYTFGVVTLKVGADLAVTERDRGNTFDVAASAPLLRNARDQVTAVVSSKYRDDDSMQTWYGVTAQQSTRSGYATYRAEGGFEAASVSLNWNHVLDKSWSINTTAGVARLVGDAADSPLTRRKNSPLLIGVVNYRF